MLLAVSEAVSSLLLFARCLFCQRLECLPSWHRRRLWQRQCATSPGGRRDLEPHGGVGGGLRELNGGSKIPVLPLPPPHPCLHPPPPHSLPESMCNVCWGGGDGEPNCTSVYRCQSKSYHHRHQDPHPSSPPPAKVGRLSPHIIPIDCLLLCLPIPSIGFVSLDDALHSTSPTLIHTVITFQYQR